MKQAILTVCFGTSYRDAWDSCIEPVVEAIRQARPECEHRLAITSRFICRKLKAAGMDVMTEDEAYGKLIEEGFTDICVVTLHMIPGFEYEKLSNNLKGLKISRPLLDTPEGFSVVRDLLMSIAQETGRTLLVMGHGTEHGANAIYEKLNAALPSSVCVACVEGERTLDSVKDILDRIEDKKVAIMPLMLVAGDHARNDLNGDEDDSWRSILERSGFDVLPIIRGLGSYKEIQSAFAKAALDL